MTEPGRPRRTPRQEDGTTTTQASDADGDSADPGDGAGGGNERRVVPPDDYGPL